MPDFTSYHTPVLLEEAIESLQIRPGEWYVDATLGGGGHAEAILKAGGKVLGIDQDADAIAHSSNRLKHWLDTGSLKIARANFRDLTEVVEEHLQSTVLGVLMDLGVSSYQLNQPERGFRFDSDTLDMRMDASLPVSASTLVDTLPESDLARLLADLGEERLAKRFARAIVTARDVNKISSGRQLAEIIERASPTSYRYGSIHPATRSFQALRIAVNDELGSLTQALPAAVEALRPSGRLAVISFHSLEDRIVKQFMARNEYLEAGNKRPVVASENETSGNFRARSAKLRWAEKKPDGETR